MKPKVVFKNVYKEYSISKSNKDQLLDLLKPRRRKKSFFAVKDISFEVYPGETIGIIGINGSGKSTLSNLLAEVIEPTAGEIEIDGESSLIAISVGLNNQLSGLENIRLKCMMHGMSENKIKEITPKIIEFADIGSFIEQPVKNYSSGMRSRLGFAISVHTNPDIIVVDEALSVGDETFYNKCMDKVNEFKELGKTIFFVSHSVTQMRRISDRVMWIHYGEMKEFDIAGKVLNNYKEYIKWYKSLSKKEQTSYKNEMFNQQIVRQRSDAKIKRQISKAETKSRYWFNFQLLFMSMLLLVMATLMVTDTPIRTGWSKTIGLIGINQSNGKIEETALESEEPPPVAIKKYGYVIDSNTFIYENLEGENSESIDIFTKLYIEEKYDYMYKIRFDKNEMFIKSASVNIVDDLKDTDITIETFLEYTPDQFNSAYLYYLAFLGQDIKDAQSKLLYSQLVEKENHQKILELSEYDIRYYVNEEEHIEKIEIPLKHKLSDDIILRIEEEGIVSQDKLKGYIKGEKYNYLIDWENDIFSFIEK